MAGRCEGCGGEPATIETPAGPMVLPLCRNCGARAYETDSASELAEQTELLLKAAGMTPKMAAWSSATYPRDGGGKAAYEQAREWLHGYMSGKRANLVLVGGVGVGKTGLAWSLIRALCEEEARQRSLPERTRQRCHGMLVVWRDLLGDMRDAFDGKDEPAAVAIARSVPVLALDDIGAERQTDWARDELAQLIEHRGQRRLPIIVTTNYNGNALQKRLGHDDLLIGMRIASRLTEGATVITVTGEDRRLAA